MSTKSKKHRVYHGSIACVTKTFIDALAHEGEASWKDLIDFMMKNVSAKHEHIFYFTDNSRIHILYDGTRSDVEGNNALMSIEYFDGDEDDE